MSAPQPAPDRSFLSADIPSVVRRLKWDEKAALLTAPNWWNTTPVPRLHVPSVRMSDGPNGVRGSSHLISTPAQCIPCATSLASTFDVDLIHQVGSFLADEAKIKSATVLLAPTCNIQRSPLGGRAFESFSEDPFLSGHMSAAYINGLQTKGVSSTIKHFVANDQEDARTAVSTEISERALREVYLYPFMLAQKLASPWAYMTAYNRVNGIHVSEHPELLQTILRKEWGFDGLVMSDWYGTYSTAEAINAGLDLEMPGPPRWRTPLLMNGCLGSRKILMSTLNKRAETVLKFVQKVARASPDIVYGDGQERSRDSLEIRRFCRRVAADGIVLLKNQGNILPIRGDRDCKIAVIGPNADSKVISGGGSAALKPTYVVTAWEGLVHNAPPGVELRYSVGAYAHKFLPTIEDYLTTPDGQPGWIISFFCHDSEGRPVKNPIASFVLPDTKVKLNDFLPDGLTPTWSITLRGIFTPTRTGPFEIGMAVCGKSRLYLNGELKVELWEEQTAGEFYYGQGSAEESTVVNLTARVPVNVLVEFENVLPRDAERSNAQPALMRGLRLGGAPKIDRKQSIKAASDLAAASDVAVVVVGLNADWESEGFDRSTLTLPMDQDSLIKAVADANPNTIVVIQAGSAVSMPWLEGVPTVIQAWHTGNEAGNALADIIYGVVNPGGRLPITLPARDEDIPAHLNFKSENGKMHYREDLFVGYKHYQARGVKPLFPFGHGLSYTTFQLDDLQVGEISTSTDDINVAVSVSVTNSGSMHGTEVVQLYVQYPSTGLTTPKLQLKGFAKTKPLAPGERATVTIDLDKYACSFWDEEEHHWRVASGDYSIFVGTSSANLPLSGRVTVEEGFEWVGL